MMKRFFALAGVSALTGIISGSLATGCSDEEKATSPPSNEAGPDVKTPTEAGPPDVDVDEEDAGTCLAAEAIDTTQIPYKTAGVSAGACSTTEYSALIAFIKQKVDANEDVKVSEWSAVVEAECASCVFGDGSGATWTPLLTKGDTLVNLNLGACMEVQSGKIACGAAYQRAFECNFEACGQCSTDEEFDACYANRKAIAAGPCKDAQTALVTDCGAQLGQWEDACMAGTFTFEGSVKALCVTGGADAGADGG